MTLDKSGFNYELHGAGNHTAILLGSFLWPQSMWAPQIDALASQGMQVLVIEYKAHGQSGPIPDTFQSLDDYAKDITSFITSLDLNHDLSIIGLSVGGMLAPLIANLLPDRVKSLVLMGTYVGAEPAESLKGYTALMDAIRQAGSVTPELAAQITPFFFSPKTMAMNPLPAHVTNFTQYLIDQPAERAMQLTRMGDAIFNRRDMREDLTALTIPVSFVTGADDQARPFHETEAMADWLRQAHPEQIYPVAGVADSGHICTVEQPVLVNKHLQVHFKRVLY